jgi:hypothetical protein
MIEGSGSESKPLTNGFGSGSATLVLIEEIFTSAATDFLARLLSCEERWAIYWSMMWFTVT